MVPGSKTLRSLNRIGVKGGRVWAICIFQALESHLGLCSNHFEVSVCFLRPTSHTPGRDLANRRGPDAHRADTLECALLCDLKQVS